MFAKNSPRGTLPWTHEFDWEMKLWRAIGAAIGMTGPDAIATTPLAKAAWLRYWAACTNRGAEDVGQPAI